MAKQTKSIITREGPPYTRYREAFEDGNVGALYSELVWCVLRDDDRHRTGAALTPDRRVEVPRWALEAMIEVMKKAIPLLPSKEGKGRHARWIHQYRQDMIDYERWDLVQTWRASGFGWKDHPKAKGDDSDLAYQCPQCGDERLQSYKGHGRSLHHYICCVCATRWRPRGSAFRKAAQCLVGGISAGTPAQVEESWRRLNRRAKRQPGRYLESEYIQLTRKRHKMKE